MMSGVDCLLSVHKEFRQAGKWRPQPSGTSIYNMTPAERESSIAFARRNLVIDGLKPSAGAMNLAAEYSAGNVEAGSLVELMDKITPPPAQMNELHTASLPADSVFARTILVCHRPWQTSTDIDELRAIHTRLFHGLGSWAGVLRGSEGDSSLPAEGYFPASLLNQGAASISSGLANEQNLTNLDRPDFLDRLTYYYDELGFLHPFNRGNAMTLRIFASRLAHEAGWDLDWGSIDRQAYQTATHRAYLGDLSGLRTMFTSIIKPANPTRIFLIAGWDQGPAH